MSRRFMMFIVALGTALGLVFNPGIGAQGRQPFEHWVGTWATAVRSEERRVGKECRL